MKEVPVKIFTVPLFFICVSVNAQLTADFTANRTTVCIDSAVVFTSTSTGTTPATVYNWSFGAGAQPLTATGSGPHTVIYTSAGAFTVTLTLSQDTITSTRTRSNYITVQECAPPNFNPFVSGGSINPSPLLPASLEGTGVLSFNFGNSGSDPLGLIDGQPLQVTVNLSNGVPDNADPIQALSGSAVSLFTWSYRNGTYTGTQAAVIPANSQFTLNIAYRVTKNSSSNNPENGFSVTVRPGPFLSGNNPADDSLSIYTYTDCPQPSPPGIGTITQPNCSTPSGSVVLTGLPSGSWVITQYPGGTTYTGSGSSVTVSQLDPGTYNFTVTSAAGCVSDRSGDVVITSPPGAAEAPVIGNITQPTCDVATGSITVNNLPSGSWTLTMNPGGSQSTGSGTRITITGVAPGTYTFTVTPASGCTSPSSGPAVVNPQPQPPSPPVVANITQPTCTTPTGNVSLSGMPSTGTWTLTINPGGSTRSGSGSSVTVTGLDPGTYTFFVTTSAGCSSEPTGNVVINTAPGVPQTPSVTNLTQPTCDVQTGSVTLGSLPASGTWTVTRNPGGYKIEGTGTSITDTGLPNGTYTYTVTAQNGCTSSPSPSVTINQAPGFPSAPVQRVDCTLGSGFAIITVTSPLGPGLEYRLDMGDYQAVPLFTGVDNGSHSITVRNAGGCVTPGPSFQVSCGCVNGPSLTLGSRNGTVCGIAPVTVSGNTFGGSATSVTITENGAGTVSPLSVTSSPFSFTYTPGAGDSGRTVIITLTTDNPKGAPCTEASATYTLTVSAVPGAPQPGTITQPGCTSSTGTVQLSGLPTGTWSLVRMPGASSISGSGASITVPGLESGTYTFTVINSSGCTSAASSPVIINPQPPIPSAPVPGALTQPTCTVATGSAELTGLPPNGTWTITRYPGTVTIQGSGTSILIHNLQPGTYNFTVTGSGGCTSPASGNITINPQPLIPQPPVTGAVTAPTCAVPGGSVVLSGLPSPGTWTITSIPQGKVQTGTGSSAVVTGLVPGSYTFTVTTTAGCVSSPSVGVNIPNIPEAPVLVINNPQPLCSPAVADLTLPAVTSGSTPGLILTYWTNSAGTNRLSTPSSVGSGTYYIKATNAAQCFDIKPITVTVLIRPVAQAGVSQTLDYLFTAQLRGNEPVAGETGTWSVVAGTGSFENPASGRTTVVNLSLGRNTFMWTLDNHACPPSTDTVTVFVRDLLVPTLITPNNDGRNDYFILRGTEVLTGNELLIFDRRGVVMFRDNDYKNDWDGKDKDGKPLPDGTYYYVFKTKDGPERAGYIMLRR